MNGVTVIQPERLDQYVARQIPAHSRAFAAKLIDQGRVLVNGKIEKASYGLRPKDKVNINYDEKAVTAIPEIDIPIIYEDKTCVVINKPTGLLSHSKGEFNPEPTVATWLAGRADGLSGDRAGIVHRLDRATSGIMICAKTPEAMSWLQKQFSTRKVKKIYTAIVSGNPAQPAAIIDMPIERNPKKPQTFRVGANGKPAVTAYKVLSSSNKLSLIELRPTTGRTHQLRVHLKHLGLPILGDTFYGGKEADRLYLHASSLEITLPNKKRQVFESALPGQFKKLMQ
jgi:23S rRNA pseudouridine1911/1915/1917 synthase